MIYSPSAGSLALNWILWRNSFIHSHLMYVCMERAHGFRGHKCTSVRVCILLARIFGKRHIPKSFIYRYKMIVASSSSCTNQFFMLQNILFLWNCGSVHIACEILIAIGIYQYSSSTYCCNKERTEFPWTECSWININNNKYVIRKTTRIFLFASQPQPLPTSKHIVA